MVNPRFASAYSGFRETVHRNRPQAGEKGACNDHYDTKTREHLF
jgi:hypothetical protein